jgi:2-keto-3-deoxy-L-rhamnonate aldolase RhmA
MFPFDAVEDYLTWCNEKTIIMVDVESKSAIDDLDAIIALDQLDVIHTGPWDLASAYGHPGHPEHPDIQTVNDAAHKKIISRTGLTCMGAGGPDDIVPEQIKRGYKCIHLGMETDYIVRHIRSCQEKIDRYNSENL